MSEIMAAIGCVQLTRLGEFADRRRALTQRYAEELADIQELRLVRTSG